MGLTLSPKFALVALWYHRMTYFYFYLCQEFLICSCCYVAPFTFSKWMEFWRTQWLYALLRGKRCKYRQRKLLVECCIEWGDYISSFYYRLLLIQFLPLWCRSIMGFHLSESNASGLDYSIFFFFLMTVNCHFLKVNGNKLPDLINFTVSTCRKAISLYKRKTGEFNCMDYNPKAVILAWRVWHDWKVIFPSVSGNLSKVKKTK